MGTCLFAARGTGKSLLLSLIAWQDFFRGVPLVVLDPIGGTIDGLVSKIVRRPDREALWERVRYVNMAGQNGRVSPWPIYQPAFPGERISATAQRFVDVLSRCDSALSRAPIAGLNALAPLAAAAGIILTALDLGITEMLSLVSDRQVWEPRLIRLAAERPETAGAVGKLRALYALSPRERDMRITALESKLTLFSLSPNFRAIFGAREPGISWPEVVAGQQAVLLDFRDIHSPHVKQFALLFVYASLLSFLKHRGHGRHTPLSLLIDELTFLVGTAETNTDLLTADLDELINRISRSHRIWLTLAGQELFQLPERLRSTVLGAGTVIFGQTSDWKTAEDLARRYFTYNPWAVKKTEGIRGLIRPGVRGVSGPEYGTVGTRTTEFSRDEQNYLNSRRFLTLPAFNFLLGQSPREGQLPTTLEPITTARLDAGQFPDRQKTDRIRSELMQRDGISEQTILADIDARSPQIPGRPVPGGEAREAPAETDGPDTPPQAQPVVRQILRHPSGE